MAIETQAHDDSRNAVRHGVADASQFDLAYVTMNALATVVACYGLFSNSPAVVIGAMIIAMLLGPIAGVALGLVDKDNKLLKDAFWSLAGGCAVVYICAFVLGAIQHDFPLTDEIYSRTAPNLMDLMIALGGGAAGAYAMISPRLSVAFVGVAIATALVPPLCSSAICLARGDFHLAMGALLLAFTNIVAIQVACSLVMWLGGYRGTSKLISGNALKRNFFSLALLLVLTVALGSQLRALISKQLYEASVRHILETASTNHNGAYLTAVRFQEAAGRTIVVAVYRTPSPFTPGEVASLEPKIPMRPGTKTLELRVRSVPVIVASRSGYLHSPESLTERDLSEQ